MKIQLLFYSLILFFSLRSSGTNYYFSSSGNDSNTGLSTSDAWKSIEKLEGVTLFPGDSVLLKRGEIFIGQITIHHSGTATRPIVVSAYGDPLLPAPRLTGATSIPTWTVLPTDSKLYYSTVKMPVKQLYLNDQLLDLARYPNSPNMLIAASGLAIGTLKEAGTSALNQATDYWKGTTVRFRSINWTWEYAQVSSFKNKTLFFTTDVRYAMQSGFKFYIENKREQLDAKNEWYYDGISQQLLFYPANPSTLQNQNLKAVLYDSGISLDAKVSYVNIIGLLIDKYADCGVVATGANKFIKVENCGFQNIEKIGVKFFRNSTDNLVNNCFLRDIRGRGISFTESSRNTISNNVVRRIGLIPGHGTTGVNGQEGITVELYDETMNEKFDRYDSIANHNIIYHNIVDSTGYIGIRADGQYNTIEKNIIEHSMLILDDGGELYCYNALTKGSRIAYNFILNSASQGTITNGIYIDNRVYNFDIQNNTITKISGQGITINAEAHENRVYNNTLFNNGFGIGFYDWGASPIFGNIVNRNTIVSLNAGSPMVVIASSTGRYNVLVSDSNYFVNPYSDKMFQYQWSKNETFNFATWRNYYPANDVHSKVIANIPSTESIVLFTNKSDSVRNLNLSGCTYTDLDNVPVNDFNLQPFTSKVLRKTDKAACSSVVPDPPYTIPVYYWPSTSTDANIFADDVVFGIISGITQLSDDSEIKIYPNPVKSGTKLCIQNLTVTKKPVYIEIKDIMGKKLYNNVLLKNEIQLPDFKSGIYFIVIEVGEKKITKKFMVE